MMRDFLIEGAKDDGSEGLETGCLSAKMASTQSAT
jgi:hypothetical protein